MAKLSEVQAISLKNLGEFPMHWKEMSLSKACRLVTDGTHDSPKAVSSGFPLITGKCITEGKINFKIAYSISESDHKEVIARSKPEKGDVLFANIGNSIGDLASVDCDIEFSIKNVALFKPGPELHPGFLKYWLSAPQFQKFVKNSTLGSAQPFIGLGTLRALPIAVPPMAEQNAIVAQIGAIDEKININDQINETLETMAKSIFKEWFIDFNPVKIKAEGKTPFGMDSETAFLFPNSFEYSELGQIPKGWKFGKLEEIAEVIGGGTPSTSEESYYCEPSAGISWLSPKDLSGYSWKYISHGATDITESGLKNSSARMLPAGTVLFSSRAPIGYVAIAEKELSTNQGFKSLVPKNGSNTEFLYYLAKANVELIESRASGSTFKEISGNGMKELPVILPPNQIMDSFKKATSEFSKLQKELRHETDNLKKTRDLILPKLISGEVSV